MRPTIPFLLLTGCPALPARGGEDDGSTSSDAKARALSTQDYRTRMNRLCREAEADAKKQPEPDTPAEIVTYLGRQPELARKYQRKVEALDPPERFSELHSQSIEDGRDAIAFMRLAVRARASDDPAQVFVDAVPRLADFVEKGNVTARELGLNACVADSISPDQREPAAS